MAKLKRLSFTVTIEQEPLADGSIPSAHEFGDKTEWAKIIQKKLDTVLITANVISVIPKSQVN